MREIEFSTMIIPGVLDLEEFEKRTFIQTRYQQLDWATAWTNVLQIGLYQKGPDVSEVGSTWLDNLKEMRALRPFNIPEIHALGGEMAFLPNTWVPDATTPVSLVTASLEPRRVFSIPWMVDTRLIFFRRDLLAKAGIPAEGAFATPEAMFDTLCRLQASGISYPLALPTGGLVIHNLASWVWGRGGHFRSLDYHKVALTEPEARRGMLDFFQLHRFIDPEIRGQDYTGTDTHFFQGKSAVMMNGQWAMRPIKERDPGIAPAVLENTGYTMPPGVPFVGSTHLVVWRHAFHEHEAMQLIAHLTSPEVLANLFHTTSNFPARVAALNTAPFNSDPDYRLVIEGIRRGRSFRSAHLWAGVETRLNALCDRLWEDLLAHPDLDLKAEIERRVGELAARLEKTLLANW